MMTSAELIAAGIPVSVNDSAAVLKANAALEWIVENTTLKVSLEDTKSVEALPASAKLFVCKYMEVVGIKPGVSSQSIEGLSMSFDTTDKSALLWQLASGLLGQYLRQVRVYPAKRRW